MKTTEIKLPNNRGDKVPTGHLLSSKEASTTRVGLRLIELFARGVPWESVNNPGCCKDNRLLSTN